MENAKTTQPTDNPATKAKELAEKLRFRLQEAMAQRGGSEQFLNWVRAEVERNG